MVVTVLVFQLSSLYLSSNCYQCAPFSNGCHSACVLVVSFRLCLSTTMGISQTTEKGITLCILIFAFSNCTETVPKVSEWTLANILQINYCRVLYKHNFRLSALHRITCSLPQFFPTVVRDALCVSFSWEDTDRQTDIQTYNYFDIVRLSALCCNCTVISDSSWNVRNSMSCAASETVQHWTWCCTVKLWRCNVVTLDMMLHCDVVTL